MYHFMVQSVSLRSDLDNYLHTLVPMVDDRIQVRNKDSDLRVSEELEILV